MIKKVASNSGIAFVAAIYGLLKICCSDTIALEPCGKGVGPVEFDAVVELNHPSGYFSSILFLRYWVAPDYYHVASVWVEPSESDYCLPIYAPSLYIGSKLDSFVVGRSVGGSPEESFVKPLSTRKQFRRMLGDYPASDLRYAEEEAIKDRLTVKDIQPLRVVPVGKSSSATTFLLVRAPEQQQVSVISAVLAKSNLQSLQFHDGDGRLVKSINYEYTFNSLLLKREIVYLPERQFIAALPNGNVAVKVRGKEYNFNSFPVTHEIGGRCCTIDYDPTEIGAVAYSLPSRIVVRGDADQRVIRSAVFKHFKRTTHSASEVQDIARQFAEFGSAEFVSRMLLSKYRKPNNGIVCERDYGAAQALRQDFMRGVRLGSLSIGERLKKQKLIIDLNSILGDEEALQCAFEDYLNTLVESGCSSVVPFSGYDAMESAIMKRRWHLADKLVDCWVGVVSKSVSLEAVVGFAKYEIARGAGWTAFQLLNPFTSVGNIQPDAQFERDVLMCCALDNMIRAPKDGTSDMARAQVDWCVSTVQADSLGSLLVTCVERANESMRKLKNLTEAEKAYRKQLESISHLERRESKNPKSRVP